ncbi:hypothetical protein [Saccharopolyspora shandongensis]|uniref:hypothetical protein n=1 Tax=Saccharopolyspora shandongensis TaxID=418495 RepID=UPI0033CEF90F
MTTIVATEPLGPPPAWAVLQRRLFDALDEAWRVYQARYCAPDGTLRYSGRVDSRDGADDFYEAFTGWPVLYRLGGSADLLTAAKRHWEAVTVQLAKLGFIVDEFERGYDWFHIGESMTFFYSLCAAAPADPVFRERAIRFAELYLPGSPSGNYDPAIRAIRAPHNGGGGPRYGINESWHDYGAGLTGMRPYGLPLEDVLTIRVWDDLADPANARRMGQAMAERLGRGDVAVNLAATSLAANAWLYDRDDRFRDWTVDYLGAWAQRTAGNHDLIPDNVGPTGLVGELHGGRWFGGHYGWTWPHGLHSVGMAVCVAGLNGVLLDHDLSWLDLARHALDHVCGMGVRAAVDDTAMTMRSRWTAELGTETAVPTLLAPIRRGVRGWFDYQPPQLSLPIWVWQAGYCAQDWERLADLRRRSGYDWRIVRDFRNKEDAGHEAPWLAYLAGDNPDYPEQILRVALSQVQRRLDLIARDVDGPADMDIHHWQRHNPVTTEALLQLTTGTPQGLYNGGLLPTESLTATRRPADRGCPRMWPRWSTRSSPGAHRST